MKIRWKGRVFLFGAKEKIAYRKAVHKQVQQFSRIAKSMNATPDKPIDFATEFSQFMGVFSAEGSPLRENLSARDRIIAVTSLLDEQLRYCISIKMSASRGALPTKSTVDSVFKGTNTLASFGDKIAFSSAFGLIPNDIKGDLGILKDIRNIYAAHTFMRMSFDDPEIVAQCQKLQLRLKIKETDYANDNERRFMESAWMVILTLLFTTMLLMEQQKVTIAQADTITKAAVDRWNETIMRKLGWPDVEIPGSSSERTA
jgi:hypothetical protein